MGQPRHIIIGGNGFLGRQLARQLIGQGVASQVVILDLQNDLADELKPLAESLNYQCCDMRHRDRLDAVATQADDIVHHLASPLITPNKPRFGRDAFFAETIVTGARNVRDWMHDLGLRQLVFWSTDMVYGPALTTPRTEDHPRKPFGGYGRAKLAAEDLLMAARGNGLNCTILRPRLIIGPGRLGIFATLFKLIERNLPVPLIGDGTNRFQFVSVSDCATASILAAQKGCPNGEFNLGSANPPTVYELLSGLTRLGDSRSWLMKTNGTVVKTILRGMNLARISPMDPEQYEIADQDVILDIGAAERELGWRPTQSDTDMLVAAYKSFRGEQVEATPDVSARHI